MFDSVATAPPTYDLQWQLAQVWDEPELLGEEWEKYGAPFIGLAAHDFNGDGWLDLWITTPHNGSRLYLNDQTGGFLWNGQIAVDGVGVAASDLDGDGDTDAVLTRRQDLSDFVIYNDGSGRMTSGMPLPESKGDAWTPSLADVDGDGDLDIFIPGFNNQGKTYGSGHHLYRNDAGAWTDISDAFPPDILDSISYHANWIDLEKDGDLDLYISNDLGPILHPNLMLLNDGSGHFRRNCFCNCELPMNGMGVGLGDFDENGWLDLLLSDTDGVELLGGQDGLFWNATLAANANPQRSLLGPTWGTLIADLDMDGRNDLLAASGALDRLPLPADAVDYEKDIIMQAQPDGHFQELPVDRGFVEDFTTHTMVIGDFDRDGRPDIVTSVSNQVFLWHNQTQGPPGLTLQINAGAGNPDGIGAEVEVEVGERTLHRWMFPSVTFGSSAPELYIGLGEAPVADLVRVTMPDGRVVEYSDVPAGTILQAYLDSSL